MSEEKLDSHRRKKRARRARRRFRYNEWKQQDTIPYYHSLSLTVNTSKAMNTTNTYDPRVPPADAILNNIFTTVELNRIISDQRAGEPFSTHIPLFPTEQQMNLFIARCCRALCPQPMKPGTENKPATQFINKSLNPDLLSDSESDEEFEEEN